MLRSLTWLKSSRAAVTSLLRELESKSRGLHGCKFKVSLFFMAVPCQYLCHPTMIGRYNDTMA